jgi:hypothetical protein
MRRATVVLMTILVFAGCYARPRSGVTPAPPGPVDLVNILIRQDYNRLCPRDYSSDDTYRDEHDGDRGPCGPRSTTCARSGRTICCAEYEGCCAGRRGLYCCAPSESRDDRY